MPLLASATSITAFAQSPIAVEQIQRAEAVSFESEVLPILRKNCLACHSASEKQGSLILEAADQMQRGGDSGAAIVPGRADESLLLKLASHQQEPVMPPAGNDVAAANLTPHELGVLKLWIDQGARTGAAMLNDSPKQMATLPANLSAVHALALTQDGQAVAFTRGNRILLHHVGTGQQIAELSDPALSQTSRGAHQDLVQSLAMNADGDLIASGGFREVKIWRRPKDVQMLNVALGNVPTAMSISVGGKWLAVAIAGNVVRLFSAADGQPGATLSGHADVINCVRFHDDGLRVITGSNDKTLRLWNVADGVEIAKFETPAAVHSIELVPMEVRAADTATELPMPEVRVVTGHADNIIRVWPMPTIEAPVSMPLKEIGGHGGPVTALVCVPATASQVYASSTDTSIRKWNIEDGQQLQYFGHSGAVTQFAVSPDGQKLAATSDNHTARIWKSDGQQIAEMRGDIRRRNALVRAQQQESAANTRLNVARQLADAADRDVPARTEAEKRVADQLTTAVTDMQTKKSTVETTLNEKLTAERAAIDASTAARAALMEQRAAEQAMREATVLVQATQARVGRLQQSLGADASNESLKQKLATAQTELEAANQQSSAMNAAVQAPTNKATELANLANQAAQKLDTVQRPWSDAVLALKVSEANHKLLVTQQALAAAELKAAQDKVPIRKEAVASAEAALTEARARVQTANEQQQQADLALRSIAFSPDSKRLVTSGDFTSAHVWDADTGASLEALAGHSAAVKSVAWLNSTTLVSVSDDQTLRVWNASPDWTLERTIGSISDPNMIAHRVTSVEFSADGSQVLIGGGVPSRSGELAIFNVADGTRTFHLPEAHHDVVYAVRFSPDGKRIASGGADKSLRTFEIATSQQLRRFEGHTSHVLSVAWRRDGQQIVSAGADNVIKVWDAESGDQQRTIENFGRHVTTVSFIGETENIASSCGDKMVRMHNASNGGLFRNFGGATKWLHSVAITPDSSVLAAGDAVGTVHLWNGNNGQQLKGIAIDPQFP